MGAEFQPGDLVRRFASLYKWPVAERTILVEGEHDQRYFKLADKLYSKETGLRLLGTRISAFPTGIGDDGGAFGLQRHFHPLRAIMDRDVTSDGRKIFHAIALFDNDMNGKRGFAALTGQHLTYRKWRDVFLLQRILPRTTRDTNQLIKLIDTENAAWNGMECEIEDLISIDLVMTYVKEKPNALTRNLDEKADGFHCSFRNDAKSDFIRFVENYALLKDVSGLVELLKSLRYHLGLPPDGESN